MVRNILATHNRKLYGQCKHFKLL